MAARTAGKYTNEQTKRQERETERRTERIKSRKIFPLLNNTQAERNHKKKGARRFSMHQA